MKLEKVGKGGRKKIIIYYLILSFTIGIRTMTTINVLKLLLLLPKSRRIRSLSNSELCKTAI